MYDVSAVKSKEREKAHAAKFATSFESVTGPAGYAGTKKSPVSLLDRQRRTLEQFADLVPKERRAEYRSAVMGRLSGSPGDGAVHAACLSAALDGFVSKQILHDNEFIALSPNGSVRLPRNGGYEAEWRSKAILGTGR